jgi:hypothetical protein
MVIDIFPYAITSSLYFITVAIMLPAHILGSLSHIVTLPQEAGSNIHNVCVQTGVMSFDDILFYACSTWTWSHVLIGPDLEPFTMEKMLEFCHFLKFYFVLHFK